MGGGGGQQPSGDSVQTFKPWGAQKPYLKDIFAQAQALSQTPQKLYPGEMLAPEDQATIDARMMAEARARGGSAIADSARDVYGRTVSGEFLNSNPYLDQMYDRAAAGVTRNFNQTILPNLESRFARAGGLDSSFYQGALGEAGRGLAGELSGMATDIYGRNYETERARQDAAVRGAPEYAATEYADAERLAGIGRDREMRAQDQLNELIDRFNFGQEEPWQRLQRYSGLIGQPVGGQNIDAAHVGRSRNPTWYDPLGLFSIFGTDR